MVGDVYTACCGLLIVWYYPNVVQVTASGMWMDMCLLPVRTRPVPVTPAAHSSSPQPEPRTDAGLGDKSTLKINLTLLASINSTWTPRSLKADNLGGSVEVRVG
jgi:hypothetical protein